MAHSRKRPPAPTVPRVLPLVLSIGTIALLGLALSHEPRTPVPVAISSSDIGISHRSGVRVSATYSIDSRPGFFEISHDGTELTGISLPESWKLRAVRMGRLEDVTQDPPREGYVQWHLPPNVTLSLTLPSSVAKLRVFNVSKTPLDLQAKRINMRTESVNTDTFLISGDDSFAVP